MSKLPSQFHRIASDSHHMAADEANVDDYRTASLALGSPPLSGGATDLAVQRLILISRPGFTSDCLHSTLNDCGFDTALLSLHDPVRTHVLPADMAIICVSHLEPSVSAVVRRRIDELRASVPRIPIMALVEQVDPAAMRDLSRMGFTAVVLGLPSIRIAIAAIQLVILGGPFVTAEIHLRLDSPHDEQGHEPSISIDHAREPQSGIQNCRFTDREAAVLMRLRQGRQNKMIAHELGISESTVKVHLRSIMAKLKVTNRTQIVCTLADLQGTDPSIALVDNAGTTSSKSLIA